MENEVITMDCLQWDREREKGRKREKKRENGIEGGYKGKVVNEKKKTGMN